MRKPMWVMGVIGLCGVAAIFVMMAMSGRPPVRPEMIHSYVYQLQKVNINELKRRRFDLAVVDWQDCRCSKADIRDIQSQKKIIVSYLSVGEAEPYRNYWKTSWDKVPPSFMEEENPEWRGSYKVRFWQEEWQEIVFDMLDQIIAAGYDGVYMDIVDGYSYFQEKGRSTARQEMVDFVVKISEYAKRKNPHFLIIPQNSPELIEESRYRAAIDGIGKESTWFIADERRTDEDVEWALTYLKKAVEAGKFVLAIDYVTTSENQKYFVKQARVHGFVPYISNRDLDQIGLIQDR